MVKPKKPKGKIVRRLGTNIFGLQKYEEVLARKPYPPGQKGKRPRGGLSEFGKELKEKQKLQLLYGLRERQFQRYVKEVLEMRGKVENASELLLQKLESRLDNVVYRCGFAESRQQARQLVSHGFFLVNGRATNIPSYQLKPGDVVQVKPQKIKKGVFRDISLKLKKYKFPSWLKVDVNKLEGKVLSLPKIEEVMPPVEIPAVFEYYAR